MSLIRAFERSGNYLFRYRGQIPVIFFLLAIPVVWFSAPPFTGLTFNLVYTLPAILLSLAGAIIRAYTIGTTPAGTSGRNTDKQVAEQLNVTGIYSVVRHPLYLGNYLMWAGLLVFAGNLWFLVLVSLAFWLYYERIMFAEEAFLRGKYGQSYDDWAMQTPAFVPRFSGFITPSVPFSIISVLRREYSGWLAQALGFLMIDYLRHFKLANTIDFYRPSLALFLVFLLLTLVLRTFKHHTSLLRESGRS